MYKSQFQDPRTLTLEFHGNIPVNKLISLSFSLFLSFSPIPIPTWTIQYSFYKIYF